MGFPSTLPCWSSSLQPGRAHGSSGIEVVGRGRSARLSQPRAEREEALQGDEMMGSLRLSLMQSELVLPLFCSTPRLPPSLAPVAPPSNFSKDILSPKESAAKIVIFSWYVYVFFIFFKILFIFRERGREGERKGEKHQCVVASCAPLTWDLAPQPRHVP